MSDGSTTLSATAFLAGLGVDTHIAYTDGEYNNVSLIISDLQYLGIDNIRDGISDGAWGSAPLSHYISIAQAGMKFTFVIGNEVTDNADILSVLSDIDQVESAVPGSVIAIEGANEINNDPVTFNGTTGLDGALAMQADLYADVKADPALSGVPVDYFTGYDAGGIGVGPDISTTSGLADDDNQHPYPNDNEAPAYWVSRAAALPNLSADGPAVYTETGYSSNNVSTYVQEVYTLDLLMDTAQQGISRTYLYDLLDAYAPGSPQGDDGYGLFDDTGAPKPVATGIHNLTTILRDTAGTASTGAVDGGLSYSIIGLPDDGDSMLLEQPDGSNIIAVWAEPQLWDNATDSEIASPTESVTISLASSAADISVYDPTTGTTALAGATDAASITIALSDHPVFVDVSAPAADLVAPDPYALCFAAGTHIRTPSGETPVETLAAGDLVMTPSGPQPVRWLGDRSYTGREIAGNHLMLPVCLRRHALRENVPARDLWVSPGHGICIDSVLVPAWRLVNGVSIMQPQHAEQIRYIHVELDSHMLLFAENCPAESFYDNGNRGLFHNAESHSTQDRPALAGAPLPRLEDGFQLEYILQRLRRRAGLHPPAVEPGALRGYVDIAGPARLSGWAQDEADPEEAVTLEVFLDGKPFTQVLANRYRADVRAAGLGSGAHGFELHLPHAGQVEVRRAMDGALLPFTATALAAQ